MKDYQAMEAIQLGEGFADGELKPTNRARGWLGPFKTLNVLIGPNNSGKSRLLRSLIKQGPERGACVLRDERLENLQDRFKDLIRAARSAPEAVKNTLAEFERQLREEVCIETRFRRLSAQPDAAMKEALNVFRGHLGPALQTAVQSSWVPTEDFESAQREVFKAIGEWKKYDNPEADWQLFYVPSLRGLRQLSKTADLYAQLTTEDYEIEAPIDLPSYLGKKVRLQLATGQGLYAMVQERLLGKLDDRRWVERYEEYLSDTFFESKPVALIPRLSGKLFIKIGREEEKPIHHLGDGLQQIIILTYPFMLNPDHPTVMFVEEPELYLHPGYQRALIDAWLARSDRLQVFVATHSSQFLDITLDRREVTVFHCSKKLPDLPDGTPPPTHEEVVPTIEVRPGVTDDFSILRDLGIRNSSVLLSNCTIWVEGVTDRQYLRHWLGLYHQHLVAEWEKSSLKSTIKRPSEWMEDLHFSFVEYSGSNITHWSFLDDDTETGKTRAKRICGDLFLIADRDDADNPAKQLRHSRLERALGTNFCLLPVQEIENLLSIPTVLKVVRSYEGDDASLNEKFETDAHANMRLGDFIEEHVLQSPSRRVTRGGRPYGEGSGTIKDKDVFAERAIKVMGSWVDVSEPAQGIVKKLVRFIEKHNPLTGGRSSPG